MNHLRLNVLNELIKRFSFFTLGGGGASSLPHFSFTTKKTIHLVIFSGNSTTVKIKLLINKNRFKRSQSMFKHSYIKRFGGIFNE